MENPGYMPPSYKPRAQSTEKIAKYQANFLKRVGRKFT